MVGYEILQDLGAVSGTSSSAIGFDSVTRLSSTYLSNEARQALEWKDKMRDAKARMVYQ
jgi:hypothetical protein